MEDPNYTQVSHRVFNIGAANHLPALSSELAVPLEGDAHLRAVDRILEIADESRGRAACSTRPPSRCGSSPRRPRYASMMHGRPTMMIELILVAGRAGAAAAGRVRAPPRRVGARPHWGSTTCSTRASDASTPLERLARMYEELNATGVFDSEFTDRIGISRRPGP